MCARLKEPQSAPRLRVKEAIRLALPPMGIAVIESHHAPDFQPAILKHSFSKIILVVSGKGYLTCGANTFAMFPNVLFHIPPNMVHRIEDKVEPVSLYAIYFDTKIVCTSLNRDFSRQVVRRWELESSTVDTADAYRAYIREMLFEQSTKRVGWEIAMQSRLGDLLVRTIRLTKNFGSCTNELRPLSLDHSQASSQRIRTYAKHLESTFYMNHSLDRAAEMTGLSRRRFTQLFRKVAGQSWLESLQTLRMTHASRLLIETQKPVTAIAFECGFDDLSHFHRLFKSVFKKSPLSYRLEKADSSGKKRISS